MQNRLGAERRRPGFLILCLLIYCAVQLGSWAGARWFWLADLASFLRGQLLVVGAVLMLWALWAAFRAGGKGRNWLFGMTIVTGISALAPWIFPLRPVSALVSAPAEAVGRGDMIGVMSANVLGTNYDPARFFALSEVRAADVLIMQEVSRRWSARLEEERETWPWQSKTGRHEANGIRLLSRFPVTDERLMASDILEETGGRNILRFEILVHGRPVVIYALHAQTPRSPLMWQQRNIYLGRLKTLIENEPDGARVILGGDWNAPPWSPFLQDIIAGTGYLSSDFVLWPPATRFMPDIGAPPWLGTPIDRLVISPGLAFLGVEEGGPFGSDHRPVLAQIGLISGPDP